MRKEEKVERKYDNFRFASLHSCYACRADCLCREQRATRREDMRQKHGLTSKGTSSASRAAATRNPMQGVEGDIELHVAGFFSSGISLSLAHSYPIPLFLACFSSLPSLVCASCLSCLALSSVSHNLTFIVRLLGTICKRAWASLAHLQEPTRLCACRAHCTAQRKSRPGQHRHSAAHAQDQRRRQQGARATPAFSRRRSKMA